jgi:hypothetical protein
MRKKKISYLLPVGDREESERHYAAVHHTFARKQFRLASPDLIGYHANRAIAQFDLNGRFEQRPEAWRFVITRWEAHDGEEGHTVAFMSETVRNLFYADRPNCIGSVAASDVEEAVLIDRMSGQTALTKYLFRYAADQLGDHETFTSYYRDEHLPALLAALNAADGLRLFVSNRVLRQAELVKRPDGTMEYTGRYVDRPSTYYYEEYYFDHDGLAEEFFTSPAALCLLRDSAYGRIAGYHVEEKCGVDRR